MKIAIYLAFSDQKPNKKQPNLEMYRPDVIVGRDFTSVSFLNSTTC